MNFTQYKLDLVSRGYKNPLQMSDLYKLRIEEEAEQLSDQFQYSWNEVKTEAEKKQKQYEKYFSKTQL